MLPVVALALLGVAAWASYRVATPNHTYSKMGRRSDLGRTKFRSSYEANYARFLNREMELGRVESWSYEPDVFRFHGYDEGPHDYTPDFGVRYTGGAFEYHEIKGFMNGRSKKRLRRMKQQYPDVRIRLVDEDWFNRAKSSHDGIDHWE